MHWHDRLRWRGVKGTDDRKASNTSAGDGVFREQCPTLVTDAIIRLYQWIREREICLNVRSVNEREGSRSQVVTYLSVHIRVQALLGCWGGDNASSDGVTRHALQGKTEIWIHVTVSVCGRWDVRTEGGYEQGGITVDLRGVCGSDSLNSLESCVETQLVYKYCR